MTTHKTPWPVLSLAFTGLVVVSLAGIVLLAVFVDELAESSWAIPNFRQAYFAYRVAWQNSTGNEFTGVATALLFVASSLPVGFDLLAKTALRYAPFGETIKGFIRRLNAVQRKYLMPFHTYLSILALSLGILHLILSSCAGNPLPEVSLILAGILVATGLFFKWKAVPTKLRKAFYQFHASLIVSGVLLVIVYFGHAVMDLD